MNQLPSLDFIAKPSYNLDHNTFSKDSVRSEPNNNDDTLKSDETINDDSCTDGVN
jgi:hypothetical protein